MWLITWLACSSRRSLDVRLVDLCIRLVGPRALLEPCRCQTFQVRHHLLSKERRVLLHCGTRLPFVWVSDVFSTPLGQAVERAQTSQLVLDLLSLSKAHILIAI